MIVIEKNNEPNVPDNFLIFSMEDIHDIYQKYNELTNVFFSSNETIGTLKEISSEKSFEDKVYNICTRQMLKLVNAKTSGYNKDTLINQAKVDTKRLKQDFVKIILSPIKGENINNLTVVSNENNLKRIFDLYIRLGSNCFLDKSSNPSLSDLNIFVQALNENIHTHSSKLVNSSAKLTINNSLYDKSMLKLGFNSRSINFGAENTSFSSGGIGREYTYVLEALISRMIYNKKITSLSITMISLINSIILNKSLTEEENILLELLNSYSINIKDLVNTFNETKIEEDLIYLSHVLAPNQNQEYGFINLIPLPSIKMLSALFEIKDKMEQKQSHLENKDKRYRFHFVKSVASNPQNISQFASEKGGIFPRFTNLPYIKQKAIIEERQFYKIDYVLSNKSLKLEDFKDLAYTHMINDQAKKLTIPNLKLKAMVNNFLREVSKKLFFLIYNYKRKIQELENKDLLKNKISSNKTTASLQKYLLSESMAENEVKLISEFLVKTFEGYSFLSIDELELLKQDLEHRLCI